MNGPSPPAPPPEGEGSVVRRLRDFHDKRQKAQASSRIVDGYAGRPSVQRVGLMADLPSVI